MQENKNLIIAIVLCLVVLFGWGQFAEYMGWVKPQPPQLTEADKERIKDAKEAEARRVAEAAKPLPTFKPSPGQDFTVDTPLYKAVFYTGGGPLRSFVLNNFKADIKPDSPLVNLVDERAARVAPLGLVINSQPSWSTGQWTQETEGNNLTVSNDKPEKLVLSGQVDNLRIRREFTFDPVTYLIKENIVIVNESEQARSARVAFTTAMDKSLSSGGQYDTMRVAWDNNGALDDENSSKTLESTGIQTIGKIYWAGPMTTYFIAAALPANPDDMTMKGRQEGSVFRVALEDREVMLNPGEQKSIGVSYWLGPKDRAEMGAVSEQLVRSIDLGWFSWIGKGLIWLLEFFHRYVNNWGIAIILLTFLIKAVFWPLTEKSYTSMEKMKQLQPLMMSIREKYKGNREMMNKETMALYKTYKVNPASGCVPILVQLPVFFGLYQALLTSLALRHASFITYLPGTDIIWLADLSAKDPLYITPIIMGLTMFLQQRMSPPPADPMQAKIMMFLPLIFTVLFLNFPSGLVIYWLVNNVLSIFQQWLNIRRHKRKPASAQETVTPATAKKTK